MLTNAVTRSINVLSFLSSFLSSNKITESQPSLKEAGDLRAQVAMYLGISKKMKGKMEKTGNPALSVSPGV